MLISEQEVKIAELTLALEKLDAELSTKDKQLEAYKKTLKEMDDAVDLVHLYELIDKALADIDELEQPIFDELKLLKKKD